jgi:hypothetical protein
MERSTPTPLRTSMNGRRRHAKKRKFRPYVRPTVRLSIRSFVVVAIVFVVVGLLLPRRIHADMRR